MKVGGEERNGEERSGVIRQHLPVCLLGLVLRLGPQQQQVSHDGHQESHLMLGVLTGQRLRESAVSSTCHHRGHPDHTGPLRSNQAWAHKMGDRRMGDMHNESVWPCTHVHFKSLSLSNASFQNGPMPNQFRMLEFLVIDLLILKSFQPIITPHKWLLQHLFRNEHNTNFMNYVEICLIL